LAAAAVPVRSSRAAARRAAGPVTAPAKAPWSWWWPCRCSKQRLGSGIEQQRLVDHLRLACRRQTQGGHGEFVDFARNALGGLIEPPTRGVVKQWLSDAGGFE